LTRSLAVLLSALAYAACNKPDVASPQAATPEATPGPVAVKLQWEENLGKAVQEAQRTGKVVLLNFTGTTWCPPCVAMEKETFSTREFADYAERKLVLAKVEFPDPVDYPKDALKLAERYLGSELKIPTYVVLDSEGKTLGKTGAQPGPEAFMAQLEKIIMGISAQ
jgi:thiol:disulfide interchange protein